MLSSLSYPLDGGWVTLTASLQLAHTFYEVFHAPHKVRASIKNDMLTTLWLIPSMEDVPMGIAELYFAVRAVPCCAGNVWSWHALQL
jgi:hypothetical protein